MRIASWAVLLIKMMRAIFTSPLESVNQSSNDDGITNSVFPP
jgi:hypothetical protein